MARQSARPADEESAPKVDELDNAFHVEFTDTSYIDDRMVKQLRDQFARMVHKRHEPFFIVSFTAKAQVKSVIIGLLLRLQHIVAVDGGTVMLVMDNPDNVMVLKTCKLDKILPIYSNLDEALAQCT